MQHPELIAFIVLRLWKQTKIPGNQKGSLVHSYAMSVNCGCYSYRLWHHSQKHKGGGGTEWHLLQAATTAPTNCHNAPSQHLWVCNKTIGKKEEGQRIHTHNDRVHKNWDFAQMGVGPNPGVGDPSGYYGKLMRIFLPVLDLIHYEEFTSDGPLLSGTVQCPRNFYTQTLYILHHKTLQFSLPLIYLYALYFSLLFADLWPFPRGAANYF